MTQANHVSDCGKPDDHLSLVISTENVRQGEVSGRMRRVLMFSLMLMLVAGAVLMVVSA